MATPAYHAAGSPWTEPTFASQIRVTRGQRTVDGKSILGLLLLAAARGSAIDIAADGPDEAQALDALGALVERGFEEA